MYWPNVLIMPLGPGPNLIMFVAPKMNPMISPTAGRDLDLYSLHGIVCYLLPPIMPPILAARSQRTILFV